MILVLLLIGWVALFIVALALCKAGRETDREYERDLRLSKGAPKE
jgi:hypothetical protein